MDQAVPPRGPAFPHRSFWSEDYGAYEPSPPLSGHIRADVAIIGAGFTGLSAAINLKLLDAALDVVVIEQEAVGFGASGRNSGWVWPNLTSYEQILARHGLGVLRETYAYAKRAYQYVGELVREHRLDSDYRETGLMRPSVSPAYESDRTAYAEFCEKLGRSDQISEMDEAEVAQQIASPFFHKALWDKELALIQPVKHARALARLARSLGVQLFEQTPAIEIAETRSGVAIATPCGSITSDRGAIATNAYTRFLRGGGSDGFWQRQRPIFLYNTMSRRLTADEWAKLGWARRNAVYTFGPGFHFGNPTADGRLHWCSDRFLSAPLGRDMSREYYPGLSRVTLGQTKLFFPSLSDIALTHHWGGPVSVTRDGIFHLGYAGRRRRIVIAVGCNGNGVALTHLNGRIVAELLTDRRSDLCDLWFVNRRTMRWPNGWISPLLIRAVVGREFAAMSRRAARAGLSQLAPKNKT